ncbi:hypothetical protein I7I48_03355 [Histoplasma ohiense]|nr:hypothetical protein I7I48_03355 [Histoplasma ohiense (nom. inval.)]
MVRMISTRAIVAYQAKARMYVHVHSCCQAGSNSIEAANVAVVKLKSGSAQIKEKEIKKQILLT